MSIYTITLKRELLRPDSSRGEAGEEDRENGQQIGSNRSEAANQSGRLVSSDGGQNAYIGTTKAIQQDDNSNSNNNNGNSSPSHPPHPSSKLKTSEANELFSLVNEADWLDCFCENQVESRSTGNIIASDKANKSGQRQQRQHSSKCLEARREQQQELQKQADRIVHSVNVTLEVTADLKQPNRIVWYRNSRQLTSSEEPTLFAKKRQIRKPKAAAATSTVSRSSIKRTRSKKSIQSAQGYSIEETVEEHFERRDSRLPEAANTKEDELQQQQQEVEEILIAKCQQVSSEKGSKLTIFDLQDEDYGQYTCKLIDFQGRQLDIHTQLKQDVETRSSKSGKYRLQVGAMDEVIEVKEGDLNIELGIQILPETNEDEELMSEEEKADFVANTTITWFKDDIKLNQNDPEVEKLFQFTYDQAEGFHRLIVRKATKETEGVYTCLVENESGTSSCSTQLVVGPGNKPKLTSRLQDVTVYVGQSLEFRIKSTGLPPIDSCQWFKDDELLIELDSTKSSRTTTKSSSSERISMSREEEESSSRREEDKIIIFRLCIDNLKLDDTGRYRCRINNEYGYDESDCFVKVLQEIIEEHEEVEETIEETMRLGGGKKSTREEEETEVIEEEEETTTTNRSVKRQKQEEEDIEMRSDEDGGRAPRFRRKLSDLSVLIEEEETTTTVIASELIVSTERDQWSDSEESLKIRWFVDDVEVQRRDSEHQIENFYDQSSEEWKHRLRIRSSGKQSRKYTCRASNKFGESETSCWVKRVQRPKFLRSLEDVETYVGESINLKVTLDDSSDSCKAEDLRFLKDGRVVYSSKTDGDSKEIKTTSKSKLRVKVYEETIEEEETITTTSRYTRRRSSGSMTRRRKGRTYELTIDNVQVDQMGSWECQAENEAGTSSCKADVEVFAEPKIVTDLPEQVRVPPSKEIRLTVEASGSPIPVYSWFKDGIGIAEEEDRVFTQTKSTTTTETTTTTTKRRSSVTSLRSEDGVSISGETLIIKDARPEDAGVYTCKIENRLGQVKSRDCKLTVIGHGDDSRSAPRIIKDLSRDQIYELDEGETVLLKVLAEGQPKPRQYWYKDTEEIIETVTRYEIENDGQEYSLKIKRSTQSDSGKYKVILRNDVGETESKTVTVKVNKVTKERESQRRPSAPTIMSDSQDKTVGLGSNISFDVQVGGHPKPLITWYKNGRRLTESSDGRVSFVEEETTTTIIEEEEDTRTGETTQNTRKETSTIHKLVITNVRESDEAIYSLKAENDLGSTKSSLVSLTVDKRKESVDEISESNKAKAKKVAEAITEEETTTTVTTTTTTTKVDENEEEIEDSERRSRRTSTIRSDEMEEDEEDEGGKKRKTTRTTRTTTTKTTTTTEEEEDEEAEEKERKRRIIVEENEEVEEEEDEERRRRKTRTIDEQDELIEDEKKETERRKRVEKMEVDEEEEVESREQRQVTREDEEEVEEIEELEERTKDKSKRKEREVSSRRRSGQLVEETTETVETSETTKVDRIAPRIVSAPKRIVAGLGSSPEVAVEVETTTTTTEEEEEETKITWLKDDQEIPSRLLRDNHIELIEESTSQPGIKKHIMRINSLRSSDAATYKLKIEPKNGPAVETGPIEVKLDRSMRPGEEPTVTPAEIAPASSAAPLAPQIVSVPEEIVAGVGSSPIIEAEIKGQPKPETTWFKDGQPIPEADLRSGHLEIVNLPSELPDVIKQGLKINNIKPADVAAYHVKAENPLGEVESEPTNVRIDRSMGPRDEPQVTQQDIEESVPMDEDKPTKGELHPVKTQPGESTEEQVAPQLLDAPKEVRAPIGSNPALEVEVKATPKAEITWLKDGEPIPDRLVRVGHVEISEEPTDVPGVTKQILKINDLRPSDAADYKIKAENPLGEVESEPIKLKTDRSMSIRDEPIVVKQEKEPLETDMAEVSSRKPSRVGSSSDLAPQVVRVPEEVVAGPGSSPMIAAEVTGQPKPEISWFKDGQLITDKELQSGHLEVIDLPTEEPNTTKQALKINNMKPADVAAYHLKAENPLGEVESEPTNVRIDRSMSVSDEPIITPVESRVAPVEAAADESQIAPQIVDAPKEVRAPLGSSPALEVEVKAAPKGTAKWLKDGEPIPARLLRDGHIELLEESTPNPDVTKHVLKVNDLRSSDAADYKLQVENPLGEVESAPIKLKTDRSMSIRDEPVVVKDTTLKTEQPETETPQMARSGSTSDLAPEMVSMPEEVVAGVGSSPIIEAEIKGLPKPETTWFKDGQPIPEADLRTGHLEIVDLPSERPDVIKQGLKINNIKPADVAAYHVKAENPLGEVESEPTNVRIDRSMGPREEPQVTQQAIEESVPMDTSSADDSGRQAPQIVDAPREIIAPVGSHPAIEIQVKAKPEAAVTWLKDGEPIPARLLRDGHLELKEESTPVSGVTKHVLKINDLKPSDAGDYNIKAENPLGEVESAPTKLKVDRSMDRGEDPMIVKGEAQPDDSGELSAPRLMSVPKEVIAPLGSNPVLEVEVKASPKAAVTWLKDGEPIPARLIRDGHIEMLEESTPVAGVTKHTLKVNDVRPSDAAAYTIKAENPLGEVESEPIKLKTDRSMSRSDEPVVVKGDDQPVDSSEQSAPQLLSVPKEVIAPLGSSPVLEVEVKASPKAAVTWLKDGEPIPARLVRDGHIEMIEEPTDVPGVTKQVLKINDVRPSDAAPYTIKAENPLGEVESEPIKLKTDRSMSRSDEPIVVKDDAQPDDGAKRFAPKLVSVPKEVIAPLGSSPVLEVEVKASPKADVTWLKDGEPIPARLLRDGHIEMLEESTPMDGVTKHILKINDVRASDAAPYTIKAENPLGEVESEPIKLKTDRSMSRSDEPIVVKDDKPTEELPTSRKASRSGSSNDLAPRVVSIPEEIVAGSGSSPMIEAEIIGQPKPDISWFKDGQLITDRELARGHLEIVELPTNEPNTVKQALKINNLKPADVAAYHIKATNPLGEVESEPTNVRIDRSMGPRDEPQVTEAKTQDQDAEAPMDLSEDVAPRKVSFARSPSIVAADSDTTSDQMAPKLLDAPEEVVAAIGSSPQLEVAVESNPKAAVRWTKNGEPIPARLMRDGHIELLEKSTPGSDITKHTLKVNDMKPSDVAIYKMVAENPIGEAETGPISLRASESAGDLVAPQIVSMPEEIVAGIGSSPVIEAEISGQPKPEITWFKDGQPIDADELKDGHIQIIDLPSDKPDVAKQGLQIDNLKSADIGAYHVKAENPAGEVESDPTNLRIDRSMGPRDEPKVTEAPKDEEEDTGDGRSVAKPRLPQIARNIKAPVGSSPILDIEVSGGPPTSVDWLKDGEVIKETPDMHVEFEELPDGTHKLHINNLKPQDAGVYQLRAKNEAGVAESGPITLSVDTRRASRIQPSDIEAVPVATAVEQLAPEILNMTEDITAGPGSHPRLEVDVKALPKAEVTWYKDGRPLTERQIDGRHIALAEEQSPYAPDAVKYILKIDKFKPLDEATYSLVAHNPLGTAESKPIHLKLQRLLDAEDVPLVKMMVPEDELLGDDLGQYAPQIVEMTDEVVAGVGSSPVLEILIKSNPAPKTTWFKDGQPITQADLASGHLELVRETMPGEMVKECLKINGMKPTDVAAYHVRATNPIGEAESSPTNVRIDRSLSANDEPVVTKNEIPFSPEEAVQSAKDRPKQAPQIRRIPRKIVAALGSNPAIEVEISGIPRPEVVWFKDGRQITDVRGHIAICEMPDGIYKLSFSNLKAVDQGDYTLTATNEAGECQSAPISLIIDAQMSPSDQPHVVDSEAPMETSEETQVPARGFAPQIKRVTDKIVAQVGTDAKIEVEVKAQPEASVSWYKDDECIPSRLIEEGHVRVEATKIDDDTTLYTLCLDSMKPSDAAVYHMEAENPFGSVKSPSVGVTLRKQSTVPEEDKPKTKRNLRAPQIKRVPRQVVAKEGTSPVLEVEVSGEPVPEIQWFRNGKRIENSDAHFSMDYSPETGVCKLTVHKVMAKDEGTYTIQATNEAGTAESGPIDLKVESAISEAAPTSDETGYAPQVVKITDEVVAGVGSSPTMEVIIKASPRAQVTWFKDGQPLTMHDSSKFEVETTKIDEETTKYTLKIHNLKPLDVAAYHVRAENPFGDVESMPINVRIDRSMDADSAPLTSSAETPFEPSEEKPKRKLRAPCIKRMPRKIVAGVGSNPVIEIEVSGEPKPEIVWFKNGRRVTEVRNHIAFEEGPDGKFKLCFTNLKATDQAEYTFTATNEAGTVESEPISLIVDRGMSKNAEPFVQENTDLPPDTTEFNGLPVEAPTILNLSDQEALPGQTVKLEAEVLGNPKPDIKWLKDGDEVDLVMKEVPDTNVHSLTLKNVNDLYDGTYSLEATNIAGVARKDAKVRIVDELTAQPAETGAAFAPQPETVKRKQPEERELREKPFIKKGLKFSQVNQGRNIKFEVQIDGKYDELIWMKDGKQINVPMDDVTMEGDEVDGDDTSTIRGESPVDLDGDDSMEGKPKRKFAPRIVARPRNVVAGPGSRIAFTVKVEGEPKPEVHWFHNGERITQTSDGKIIIEEYDEGCIRLIIEDVQESDVGEYHVMAENVYGNERTIPVTLELDQDMVASDDLANTSGMEETPSSLYAPDSPLKRGRAPRILSRPKSVHAGKGSKVFFEVQVSGEPEPVVNWFRDGRVIKQTSDGHVTVEEYSNGCVRLVLSDITDADVGQYHVVAENKLGSERTIPVTLTIDETAEATDTVEEFVEIRNLEDQHERRRRGGRPPRILLRPKHLQAAPGGDVTLEVSVVGHTKESKIVWHKNGKRVETSSDGHIRIEEISDGYQKLCINNVTLSDAGSYTVSAENDFGASMSQPAELVVDETVTTTTTTTETTTTESFYETYVSDGTQGDHLAGPSGKRAPRFTIRPKNRKAPLGGTVDFEVKVSGEPKPDVVWYKNGRRIHTTADGRVRVEEFSDGGSKLIIEDLEETDHGVYAAEASNEMGKVRTEDVQLRVTQKTETSEHVERSQRGSTRVTTRTKKTTSHYTFAEERNGYVTLSINDAQLEHDGDYKLIVRNKWGEASTQAPLVVIPKVEPRSTYSADRSTTHDGDSSLDGRDSRSRRTPFDELEDYGHELDKSVGVFGSESHYQSGEDTYLLQLRDTEFPLRLRKYLRFGARQSPSLRSNLMDAHWGAGARVTVRERRKFREVMDEEIDDEKRGLDTRPTPMRLQKEISTCGNAAARLENLRVEAAERVARKSAEPGQSGQVEMMMPPFFREKLKDVVVEETGSGQQEAVFACLAVGEPKPDYTWFKNDNVITDVKNMIITTRPDGGSQLHIPDPRLYDAGCFKCVARNVHGNVTSRARLRVASRPSRPEPAEYVSVTSREVFLQWRPPRDFDTNVADVLGYKLEMSQSSVGQDDNWTILANDIGHEFYVVDDLTPATSYSFRISARNKFGWSDTSYSTYMTTAKADSESSSARLAVPHEMRNRQYTAEVCDPHQLRHCEEPSQPDLDYEIESNPVKLVQASEQKWSDAYTLQTEIARGRFSVISKAVSKSDNQQVAIKAVLLESMTSAQTKNEFDILRSLQHEKVVKMHVAFKDDDMFLMVMERLSGLDVLTYLSSFASYSEETVSKIITQVMDAIEYLHFRGMCLLELLPDNVVMTNGRTTSLKLVDFSAARFVPQSGARVPLNMSQNIEYCPPEVIAGHEVSTASDVWCIGVLTYVLLSGFSPFKGESEDETRENVRLGRYKYDHIYGNCTPEVTRFLINVFKKHSSKRPTIEQLYENKWLLPNEFMIRKRTHATFKTDKIVAFAEEFHRSKSGPEVQCPQRLIDLMGEK